MATKVMMEALSPTMEEGRLVKWLKNVGEAVKSGETIAEVETDKAIMDLVARGDGVLRVRLVEEGTTSAIGDTLAVIAAPDEDISRLTGGTAAAVPVPAPAPTTATAVSRGGAEHAETATISAVPSALSAPPRASAVAVAVPAQTGPVRSSPLARRLASEHGIALNAIVGSGPNGRIIRRDIEAVATTAPATHHRGGTTARDERVNHAMRWRNRNYANGTFAPTESQR